MRFPRDRLRPVAAAVGGLAGFVLVALFLVGVGLWSGLAESDRAVLERALREQAGWLAAGVLLLVGGLALIMAWLFGRYVTPLRRMTADTRLMASTNRAHRIQVPDPPDLAALASSVNELAERAQASEEQIAQRVAAARAELAQERNRLAALMAELSIPVLVCTFDGRILLYNEAARSLLGAAHVGLGRSLFGVLDRGAFTHLLERIGSGSASATATVRERLLHIHAQAVAAAGDGAAPGPGGVVLTFEDLTSQVAAAERRDALVRALTEQIRGAVANIRAAVEMIVDYPDMDADGQRRFARIIQDEAQRLSAHVALVTPEYEQAPGDRSLREDVQAGDLLVAIERRLAEAGTAVSTTPAADDMWLSVDSFGAVRLTAELVGWLVGKHAVTAPQLAVVALPDDAGGRYAGLDVRWRGTPLDAGAIRKWADQPAVREWLHRQGAETWSGRDGPHGTAFVRLLLPRAVEPPAHEVAPLVPPQPAGIERHELYDFDLFRVVGTPEASAEWDARALADLAYTVLDTETTGLAPDEGDEIVSIGAVRVVNRRVLRTETFERLVDPRRRIPAASYAIHGISGEMVHGQPVIEEVLPELARFAQDTVLVGHEIGFDMSFIARKEQGAGVHLRQPMLDTRLLSLIVHPEHERHSLEAIAERLGVSVVGRHTALGDALVTAEVFVRLLPLLEARGVRTLGAVRAAASALVST